MMRTSVILQTILTLALFLGASDAATAESKNERRRAVMGVSRNIIYLGEVRVDNDGQHFGKLIEITNEKGEVVKPTSRPAVGSYNLKFKSGDNHKNLKIVIGSIHVFAGQARKLFEAKVNGYRVQQWEHFGPGYSTVAMSFIEIGGHGNYQIIASTDDPKSIARLSEEMRKRMTVKKGK